MLMTQLEVGQCGRITRCRIASMPDDFNRGIVVVRSTRNWVVLCGSELTTLGDGYGEAAAGCYEVELVDVEITIKRIPPPFNT